MKAFKIIKKEEFGGGTGNGLEQKPNAITSSQEVQISSPNYR
jgi:hypothetical protein